MNSVLQNKLNELQNASDYECWYLVKQPTAFDNICYLVSFLKEFKSKDTPENLQDFIGKKVTEINASKPNVEISNNYRALRVAAFFGLITMTSSKYEEAIITETFEEINNRCGGAFENKELYEDIIQRQIEKMYISSTVDEGYNGVRQDFRLYPVMLLYKVLLELGRSTGAYKISMTEYRYLVATTKVFENFLEALLLIKLLREDSSANAEFEQYRTKFDNRLIQALKQLPTLVIDRDSIAIKAESVEEVAKKVGIGAVIFNDLYNSRIKDEIFDWDIMLNFNGETGPYIQYMCVRTKSVLEKAGYIPELKDVDLSKLDDENSKNLINILYNFNQTLVNVTEKEEPSILSRYLISLAKEYSSFYNNCHILNEDKSLQDARLYLTYMVKTVLEKGLNLLGIQVPDKM